LVDACKLLSDRGVDFRGYLLGDGPLRATLQQQIDRLGLADRIILKGSQSSRQLSEWYRAADLSVLASLSEGVPNVLLESLACGTPFVATNVGGIPEIADLNFDRLVPRANPEELAEAIVEKFGDIRPTGAVRRRFEPLTAIESARTLAAVIDSVRPGERSQIASNVPQEVCV
jgi:glycosyltransferase involved in cell wall biosynthesis